MMANVRYDHGRRIQRGPHPYHAHQPLPTLAL